MSLNYNKINVMINNQTVLAESLSLTQSSEQRPIYLLNNSRPYDNSPTVVKNSINLSYLIDPGDEPNYLIISGWRNNITGNLNCTLNIGDILIPAHLNSYSFEILPSQVIKAQASYLSFQELTGNFTNQNTNDSDLYNLENSTGIGHYWAVGFTSGTEFVNIENNNILQCNYSFQSNVLPSYKLGSYSPCQVSVLDATEEINVVSETQNQIKFSGQNYNTIFSNGIDNLRIRPLSYLWDSNSNKIDFSLSGFEIQTNKSDISINNLIVFEYNLKKYY